MFSHITSGLGALLPATEICALARRHRRARDRRRRAGDRPDPGRREDLGCDAYVASPHKWLLAPKGTGILYIRRDVQRLFWNTLASGSIDGDSRGAFRFMQYGTGSVPVVQGLMAALEFITGIGIDRIERWDMMLTTRLRDGLSRSSTAKLTSPADRAFAVRDHDLLGAGHDRPAAAGRALGAEDPRARAGRIRAASGSPRISTSVPPTSIAC